MSKPELDEEKWVKDFVALLKPQAPHKTDEELDKFAREMLAEAQERGRAMSEISTDTATDGICPFTYERCIDEGGYCKDGDCLAEK